MEIKKDIKNALMKRRELKFVVEAEKNPSFEEISKLTAEHFKSNEDQILVERIKGRFGRKTFLIDASIYDTQELKEEAKKRQTKVKKAVAGGEQAAPAEPKK